MKTVELTKGTNYLNRECTWINFNERVLHEAVVAANPLLEKLNFIAISASNLDEFFMIRIAGIKHLIESGVAHVDIAGMTPLEQFAAIAAMVHAQTARQYAYLEKVSAELEREGVYFAKIGDLTPQERQCLQGYIEDILPVLKPIYADDEKSFPFLPALGLNLVFLVRRRNRGDVRAAVVSIPPETVKRLIPVGSENGRVKFVFVEDAIRTYAAGLFEKREVLECAVFRITRDADLDINDEAEDLLREVEKSLKKRRKGAAVRLEIEKKASRTLCRFLKKALRLHDDDIYMLPGPIDLTAFFAVTSLAGYEHLHYPPFVPQPVRELLPYKGQSLWQIIGSRDIMLHHPYESFDAVDDFICAAAADEQVISIKQTLYRVSRSSVIIDALTAAAKAGKQVIVLMEVKARFDEENNITMARRLEQAGCRVIYGVTGLKTHSKITLVARREGDGIRHYMHLATGNYNGKTARIYTDVGIFTSDSLMGTDGEAFFDLLLGKTHTFAGKKLGAAPFDLRQRIYAAIDEEIVWAKTGKKGHIMAKMNSLLDKAVITKLYKASQAGVKVDLIVRGICVLRPGVPGLSENITVHSIVGRFLEHSRLFYFYHNGAEDIFLSSADWMPRNLNDRIELLVPVEYGPHKERIKHILNLNFADNVKTHVMDGNGMYHYVAANTKDKPVDAQLIFRETALNAAKNVCNR